MQLKYKNLKSINKIIPFGKPDSIKQFLFDKIQEITSFIHTVSDKQQLIEKRPNVTKYK